MSEEFEGLLDEQLDLAGEGLRSPDEVDLAVDREDRKGGESQTETPVDKEEAANEDATGEQFVYTTPEGGEIKGTLKEITEEVVRLNLEAQKSEAKPAEVKPAEPKPEEGVGELPFEVRPIDPKKGGEFLAAALEKFGDGDTGALAGIIPEIQELSFQTFAQDPRVYYLVERTVNTILDGRESGAQKQSAFQEFVGEGGVQEADIQSFMKANPWASTKEMAVLGLQTKAMKQEIANLKTGKIKEVAAAEKKGQDTGAKKALQEAKAKGSLRRISGGGKPSGEQSGGKKPQNEGEMVEAWANKIQAMRQGA